MSALRAVAGDARRLHMWSAILCVGPLGVLGPTVPFSLAQESRLIASLREQAVEQKLARRSRQEVSWYFQETPLAKVVAELSRLLIVKLLIDKPSLMRRPDTCRPSCATCYMLAAKVRCRRFPCSSNLDWYIDGEAVVIATEYKANSHSVTRVYPAHDLVAVPASPETVDDADSLIDIITSTVAAPTWDRVRGQGEIVYYPTRRCAGDYTDTRRSRSDRPTAARRFVKYGRRKDSPTKDRRTGAVSAGTVRRRLRHRRASTPRPSPGMSCVASLEFSEPYKSHFGPPT